MQRVGDVDEFELIERLARRLRAGRPERRGGVVRLGIGDDAALLRPPPGCEVAVSTDAFVEGVHFRFDWQEPAAVGRSAVAACLSDLAAMGADPMALVWALSLPADLPLARLDALARGGARAARDSGCPLVGGNLARGPGLSLALTAIGSVRRGRALRRDAARPGDRLFVTGALGARAIDVALARAEGRAIRRIPVPRLGAGRALGRRRVRGACIDVSDGLLADLDHLLSASAKPFGRPLGARLVWDALPLARGVRAGACRLGLDPRSLAATGGEDYELLFTQRPGGASPAQLARSLGVEVSEIGRVTAGRGLSGVPRGLPGAGYRHFGAAAQPSHRGASRRRR